MAKMVYRHDGLVIRKNRLKFWAILGWTVALGLSVIMAKGLF